MAETGPTADNRMVKVALPASVREIFERCVICTDSTPDEVIERIVEIEQQALEFLDRHLHKPELAVLTIALRIIDSESNSILGRLSLSMNIALVEQLGLKQHDDLPFPVEDKQNWARACCRVGILAKLNEAKVKLSEVPPEKTSSYGIRLRIVPASDSLTIACGEDSDRNILDPP